MQVHAHLRNYPHDVLARNPSFKIIDSCTHSPFTKRWKINLSEFTGDFALILGRKIY